LRCTWGVFDGTTSIRMLKVVKFSIRWRFAWTAMPFWGKMYDFWSARATYS